MAACPHDGARSEPAQVPPLPPALHAKFSQIEPYAQGQTGTSYLATQTQSGRRGLIKLIALSAMAPAERVRLKRELRKQTQLVHDGLPRIFDGGEVGPDLWLFRELVEGESLAQRIRRLSKLELGEALTITAQVASALDELQRSGLLHRDVKPGHIILAESAGAPAAGAPPMAKLIDAGVAARLSTGSVFDLIGTPAYISPEQVAGKLVSFRSDLYALGCVLYEMLQGEPPFPSEDVNQTLEAHKSVAAPTLTAPLPPAVQTLLHAMLAKEPRQRPFSAQQVRRTLEPLLPQGARLPPLGAKPVAPLAAAAAPAAKPAAKFPREEDTQEIDLDEVGLPSPSQAPPTMLLGDTDIAELAVPPTMPPRTTLALGDEELGEPEPVPQAAGRSAAEPVAAVPQPAPTDSRAGDDAAREPAPAAQSAAAAVPARPSVAFDVESLFDDDVPAEASAAAVASPGDGLGEAGGDDDGPKTQLWTPAATAPAPSSRPPAPDPEGTVLAARPGVRKRSPMVWLALVAAAFALLLVLWNSGDDEPSAATETPAASAPESPAKPAAEAPAEGREASPTARAEKPSPAPAKKAPPPAQPAAEPAPAEPPPAQPMAEPGPAEPPAVAQPAAEPLPAAAPVAAGEPTEPPIEVTMPNQAGGGSSRLAGQRSARAERLAKAEEFKAQGRAHFQARRYREAAAAYEKATELNPSDAGAYAGLGASRLEGGDANAAVQAYSNAVRLQGNSSGFHAALGRAYLTKGDRFRARSAYARALELNPNNAAARTALAQIK